MAYTNIRSEDTIDLKYQLLHEADFAPLNTWSDNNRNKFGKVHLNNKERFQLFHFFVYNGMGTEDAMNIVLCGSYDQGAKAQLVFLKKKWENNPEFFSKYEVFDIEAGHVV